MSIETLLEAAKFLELQAQLQQKAREDELKEKLCVKLEQKPPDVTFNSRIHLSNGYKAEEVRSEPRPAPRPPSLPQASMPITVIPIPVVSPNPSGSPTLPVAMLSPPAPPKREPHSPQERSAPALPRSPQPIQDQPAPVPTPNHKQPPQSQPQAAPQPASTPPHQPQQQPQPQPQQQRYPGSIVSSPQQHALLPQPLQQTPPHNGAAARASPPDDGRQHYPRKRPGGAGTRESHNKLEQNRRAHLKECFETLKKNIPNIDEKKTSNLSVLRSALRYIQTLKRKEKEYEHDMERLAREKIATQQRLAELKNELSQWMDVMEIDRVLRQTVQPEEDQASTSTASEGEDIMEDDLDEETSPRPPPALPSMPQTLKPEPHKPSTPPQPAATLPPPLAAAPAAATSFLGQHRAPLPQPQLLAAPAPRPALPAIVAATSSAAGPAGGHAVVASQSPMVTAASLHPTVIAHASVSHPSVIQAVNHVIQGGAPKQLAHLAPSVAAPPGSLQLAPGPRPIGHITVHPVAHLGQHLPALYPQPVAVTQPAVISHIAHTLGHAHVNGSAPSQPPPAAAAIVGKQTAMVAHHPQLVGQTVLNPVTMVTMPSFPIGTLKLA